MILIIGSTHDDILYFETALNHPRKEVVLGKYPVVFGTVFNQEVMLAYNIETTVLSSALALYLIERYFVMLTFVVGHCAAFSKKWKPGEIAVSYDAIAGDVNLTQEKGTVLGQVPGEQSRFLAGQDIISFLRQAMGKRTYTPFRLATFVSCDSTRWAEENAENLSLNGVVFGETDKVVFDHNTAGVALACSIAEVPYVSVKVVEHMMDGQRSVEFYAETLKRYVELGKAIVSAIGDIASNDILKEEGK